MTRWWEDDEPEPYDDSFPEHFCPVCDALAEGDLCRDCARLYEVRGL